jgi:hypothetical protein
MKPVVQEAKMNMKKKPVVQEVVLRLLPVLEVVLEVVLRLLPVLEVVLEVVLRLLPVLEVVLRQPKRGQVIPTNGPTEKETE